MSHPQAMTIVASIFFFCVMGYTSLADAKRWPVGRALRNGSLTYTCAAMGQVEVIIASFCFFPWWWIFIVIIACPIIAGVLISYIGPNIQFLIIPSSVVSFILLGTELLRFFFGR